MANSSNLLKYGTVMVMVLALATTAACTATVTSTDRAGSSSKSPTSSSENRKVQPVTWAACDDGPPQLQCAHVDVPLDYDKPNGKTISIAMTRIPALDADERIGAIFVNPGGPGGSGTGFVSQLYLGQDIANHFDLVGFDPRGVGASTPLECNDTVGEMYARNPAPRTKADTTALLDASEEFVEACNEKYGDMLAHLGTRDVARDLDQLRAAMGEPTMNYLGYSYGTSIGQVYAEMFPDRVRTMILDGVVKLGEPGLDAALSQGKAFEETLKKSLQACRDEPTCPIGKDPGKAFDTAQKRLQRGNLPARMMEGRSLTAGTFQLGVGQSLYSESMWPQLWRGVAQVNAAQPDGSTLLAAADSYLDRQPDGTYGHVFEVYFAVSCLDWSWPRDPNAILQAGRDAAKVAPRMGEAIVTDYVRCGFWPTPSQPLTPVNIDKIAPIIVVSTTNDPATPYRNGAELADRIPGAVLITKVGSSHTAFGSGDPCVDKPIEAYLMDGSIPAKDLRCSA